jgi:Domain of unknown function (DUF4365)
VSGHASWQQEQFSLAYVRAVAASAGFAASKPEVDYDGIDLTIAQLGGDGDVVAPKIDLQVKSQVSGTPSTWPWPYKLKVANHERLRGTHYASPRILVVVAMPANVQDWLGLTDKQLSLRHCAYWISVYGEPATTSTSTVTVKLSRNQRFSPDQLRAIMKRVEEEKLP